MKVRDAQELAEAIEAKAEVIEVVGTISGSPSIRLPEGTTLTGGTIEFKGKGLRLSAHNTVRDITVTTTDYDVAIYNDTTLPDAGTFILDSVTTVGQIYIVAEHALKNIRVEASNVWVKAADVRGRVEQPHGFGVDVLQGGLTLWNRNPDPDSRFTATLRGIKIGTAETPVRGSGIFVDGYTDREGKLTGGAFTADIIETSTVTTDGGIPLDTPDKISGGVFVLGGATVDRVENNGPVTTYGQNDMVLDLWGRVETWEANDAVRSMGPSGIGFVNFGDLGDLIINAPIATSGLGARGFNVYDGTLRSATFQSITTHGDGAIGIQISKPVGPITVNGDVRTTGGEGMSLVKGVQTKLKASAISIKDGGAVAHLTIAGTVSTQGDNLVSFEVNEGGAISDLSVRHIEALGADSVETRIDGTVPAGSLD